MRDHEPAGQETRCRLSVIIPMYNEEKRIGKSLERIAAHLGEQSFSWEILAVDDGSVDLTRQAVEEFLSAHPSGRVRLLSRAHRGKGHAVKIGMLEAKGEFALFTDADLSTPIEEVTRFLSLADPGYDIAIGSREAAGARRFHEPVRRHLAGRVFNYLVRALAVRKFNDTQCGFKLFHREAVRFLFERQTIDRFGFDVEILFLAQKHGLRILEIPVPWYYHDSSTVRVGRDGLHMGLDVLRVRWNDLLGRYD